MEVTMNNPEYLNDKQYAALMGKIATLLNGVPISQAHCLLADTNHLIDECHTVDTENPRFKAKIHEIEESGVSFG